MAARLGDLLVDHVARRRSPRLCGAMSASRARIRKASITASMSRPARWMRCSERCSARRHFRIGQHHVGGHADHGQRRAQFMAGVAGEVALALHERRVRAAARPCNAPPSCCTSPCSSPSGRVSAPIACASGCARIPLRRRRLASQFTGDDQALRGAVGQPATPRRSPAARAASDTSAGPQHQPLDAAGRNIEVQACPADARRPAPCWMRRPAVRRCPACSVRNASGNASDRRRAVARHESAQRRGMRQRLRTDRARASCQ